MPSKTIAIITTVLGAAAAALAVIPYQWARITAASLAGLLAALHPVSAAVARTRKGAL